MTREQKIIKLERENAALRLRIAGQSSADKALRKRLYEVTEKWGQFMSLNPGISTQVGLCGITIQEILKKYP